ncbi:hypothetical protein NE237_012639 [Protea cynaroides]|uniref:Uncharacterized protein n=1 Tax=Protea cynaroides TaxID=273540 RepID=A0A9Q0GZH4_9MAGN|nr:hypothetical protein NE237_012639 [Protea cynaroides]
MDGKRTENLFETIKQVLAKALVHFYPLTGRFKQDPDGRFIVNAQEKVYHLLKQLQTVTFVSLAILQSLISRNTENLFMLAMKRRIFSGCECNAGEQIGRPLTKSTIESVHIQSLDDYIEATSRKIPPHEAFVGNKWFRLPSNDIDFGWGSPKQFTNANPQKGNSYRSCPEQG